MGSGTGCLTFDFDAVSLWISRNILIPTPISRGEFGAVAVPRILNLLSERNIPSTWFIPGHTVEASPEVCREIVAAGHEVGLHGYAHENVGTLDERQERETLRRSYSLIGDLTVVPPRGNRALAWDLTPHTVDIMLGLGLVYGSTLMGNDYSPYYIRRGDVLPQDAPLKFGETTHLVELPVSWSLGDYPHLEYLRLPHSIMLGLRSPRICSATGLTTSYTCSETLPRASWSSPSIRRLFVGKGCSA